MWHNDVIFWSYMHNVFFNTRVKGPVGILETAGDKCLAPVRLLWKGKTVTVEKADDAFHFKKGVPSYKIEERTVLKKLLSFAALPFAAPLGILLKGLSYLSKDTRDIHRLVK